MTSFVALLIATPLAIAIGLYLSELAPRGVRGIVGSLVEMLAAIPSVVLGLWGILVLGPFLGASRRALAARARSASSRSSATRSRPAQGLFTAVADPHDHDRPDRREHLPRALPAACRASSRTARSRSARRGGRWCAGSSCPSTRSGIAAAMILGLGRALGEAIAVTQVIGGGTRITASLFAPADTLASKIAASYQGADPGSRSRRSSTSRRSCS